jgi:hypothetical protein
MGPLRDDRTDHARICLPSCSAVVSVLPLLLPLLLPLPLLLADVLWIAAILLFVCCLYSVHMSPLLKLMPPLPTLPVFLLLVRVLLWLRLRLCAFLHGLPRVALVNVLVSLLSCVKSGRHCDVLIG